MDPVLQVILGSHVVLIGIAAFITFCSMLFVFRKLKKHPNILLGINGLLQSPSGIFGLLTLVAITVVTLLQPTVGGVAFAAFVGVVPAILTIAEHRETLAGIVQTAPPTPVDSSTTTVTVSTPASTANFPARGTL